MSRKALLALAGVLFLGLQTVIAQQSTDTTKVETTTKGKSLGTLTIGGYGEAENMNSMFYGMAKLRSLDLSSFEPLKVTKLDGVFQACSELISIDLSNFRTPNVASMSKTFYGLKCYFLNNNYLL